MARQQAFVSAVNTNKTEYKNITPKNSVKFMFRYLVNYLFTKCDEIKVLDHTTQK